MVRLRMGEKASRFTLLALFSSMLVANLYVMGRAISGNPIRIEGFETKEEGRKTFEKLYQIDSYEKVKQEFMDSVNSSPKSHVKDESTKRKTTNTAERNQNTKPPVEDEESFYIKIKK
ncbi:hypothetical protein FDP41_000632 [Naegleria fowleri]|uniref:Uncharacterized protein n=1 Tax=Naegleria fowleri TaxID=5763 RepID=A0A6A5C2T3_NAEFO|nr:uncharacterized protein FDP41_000632 [Naegleria fowleri]KAF0984733.1 hypothetical protein FDP41_000632 [Naegleria fowleri]CAG4716763.1 unnamed protein product [Naegleria fowleri]